MKWWPGECKPGDMVRVKLGSIYHFGVYVSDEEIIQFGLPPVNISIYSKPEDVKVLATDIDTFACGQIVEVAVFDKKELKSRIPVKKSIEIARNRIGEDGYNLIHNNCEHFAYQCIMGIKYSSQEEEAKKHWADRPIADIFLYKMTGKEEIVPVADKLREKEISSCRNDEVKREKYCAWWLLGEAFKKSAYTNISTVNFKKSSAGKWTADGHYFSISHSNDIVAVIYSNSPCGIDVETIESTDRIKKERLPKLAKIVTGEEFDIDADGFLREWTKKESIFKYSDLKRFIPKEIINDNYPTETIVTDNKVYISITSDNLKSKRFFVYNGEKFEKFDEERLIKEF